MASRIIRPFVGIAALAVATGLLVSPPTAIAEGEPHPPGLLDEAEAVALALESGVPVVASALTDEHTLVTADPETGLLSAELSAGVARVPDGADGWREPSATLVPGPNGSWRAEAAAVPLVVSGGGAGAFLTLGESDSSVEFGWPEALPEPVVEDTLATFAEVAPGVDLVVRAAVDGAESFLVVKDAEAAQDPLVRQLPITVASGSLQPVASEAGTVGYVDATGEERFWVPPAYLWDSAGQAEDASLADLLEPAEGSRVEELPAQTPAGTAGRVAFDASTSLAVLDDPDTVFPVVIDPSVAGTQSYAARVTEDFTKFNSDIGSEGKLGYNGWTSPYYKSRMYYQFRWPTVNGLPVPASRINSAEFSYVQTHSPQHSCSDTDFGPAVKVQFHYVIDSGTKWSNQPDVHPDIGSVSSDYAVGHEDVCNKTYTQKWNVSSMVKKERATYDTRTTVTVGLRSADESDKNGWREYKHSSGSSPKLVVTFQGVPVATAAPTFSPVAAPGITNTTTPTLSVKVSLQSGDACVTTNCLRAEFQITKPGGTTVTLNGNQVANGGTSQVVVPPGTMLDLSRYTVRARARSVDSSAPDWGPVTTIDVRTNAAPAAPTGVQVTNDSGTPIAGSPAIVTAGAFRLRATAPAGTWCLPEAPACLGVEFAILKGTATVKTVSVTGLRAGGLATTDVIVATALDGDYTVTAKAFRSWTTTTKSAAATTKLRVLVPPARPSVTELTSSGATLSFRVQVTPAPLTEYIYAWTVDFTDADTSKVSRFSGDIAASGNATLSVRLAMDPVVDGEASLQVIAKTPAGAASVISGPYTVLVYA